MIKKKTLNKNRKLPFVSGVSLDEAMMHKHTAQYAWATSLLRFWQT